MKRRIDPGGGKGGKRESEGKGKDIKERVEDLSIIIECGLRRHLYSIKEFALYY